MHRESLTQNGKVVGTSSWSGIQISPNMANYQVTMYVRYKMLLSIPPKHGTL
jgi:hypothetical protein